LLHQKSANLPVIIFFPMGSLLTPCASADDGGEPNDPAFNWGEGGCSCSSELEELEVLVDGGVCGKLKPSSPLKGDICSL